MNTLILIALIVTADPQEYRTWTSSAGMHTRTAAMVSASTTDVILKEPGGNALIVGLDKLSQPDRDYVATTLKKQRDAKLSAKRADHTQWIARVAGSRPVTIQDTSIHGGYGMKNMGTDRSYRPGTQTFYYHQKFTGTLLDYDGREATIKVNDTPMKFKSANLATADQRFLAAYRELEQKP